MLAESNLSDGRNAGKINFKNLQSNQSEQCAEKGRAYRKTKDCENANVVSGDFGVLSESEKQVFHEIRIFSFESEFLFSASNLAVFSRVSTALFARSLARLSSPPPASVPPFLFKLILILFDRAHKSECLYLAKL